jgi:hypothetical protein
VKEDLLTRKILATSAAALLMVVSGQAAQARDDVVMEVDPSLPTHVIYRPASLDRHAPKTPLIAFGNGACANRGDAFATFLRAVAARGYVVTAPGPILGGAPIGAGEPEQSPSDQMITVLDWASREDSRSGGRWAGRLDLDRIAVMGQSCGGLEALAAGADRRVKTVVVLNSGIIRGQLPSTGGVARPPRRLPATEADLARLHTPILYLVGGPRDIAYAGAEGDYAAIDRLAIFNANLDVGHGGTWLQTAGGRMGAVAIAWLDWRLNNDNDAGKTFTGARCGLCGDPKWTVKKKNMP